MVIAKFIDLNAETVTFPHLPAIPDASIEEQVFTHPSFYGNPAAGLELARGVKPDNTILAVSLRAAQSERANLWLSAVRRCHTT